MWQGGLFYLISSHTWCSCTVGNTIILSCPPILSPKINEQEEFAAVIIPQYFDHNKFSSFARQLNFYGFRKIQTKPIRNEDFNKSTAKHVTFFNEKFKRGRYDLLKDIQRSTRGGGAQASLADQAREVESLQTSVIHLEGRVQDLEARLRDVTMKMHSEIQSKVEYAVLDLLSSQRGGVVGGGMGGGMGLSSQLALSHTGPGSATHAALQAQAYSMGLPSLPPHTTMGYGGVSGQDGTSSLLQRAESSLGSIGRSMPWDLGGGASAIRSGLQSYLETHSHDQHGREASRTTSITSINRGESGGDAAPTLLPHPKQKNQSAPVQQNPPLVQSLQGGGGGVGFGGTIPNSSMLLRNAWEDKFFSTLMMQDGVSRAASLAGAGAGGMSGMGSVGGPSLAALAAVHSMQQQGHPGTHMGMSMGMMGHHPGVTQAYMQQQQQQRELSRINSLANATYNGAREIGEQKAEMVEM